MKEKDFDKIIGDKLRGIDKEPSAELFSRIEETLSRTSLEIGATRRRRKLLYGLSYGVAAAAITAFIMLSVFIKNDIETISDTVIAEGMILQSDTTDEIINTATDATDIIPEHSTTLRRNVAQNIAKVITPAAAETITAEEPAAVEFNSPKAEDTYDNILRDSEATASTGHSRNDHSNITQRQAQNEYWANLIAQDSSNSRRKSGKKISLSMYAGNFGAGQGDVSTTDRDKIAAGGLLFAQDGWETNTSDWDAGISDMSGGSPFASTSITDAELKHQMPLNVGLDLAIPVAEDVAIITGVNYSYLHSTAKQQISSGSETRITREQHYIGIPLGVSYTFFDKKNFNIYVYGGVTAEKGVTMKETYKFSNPADSSEEIINSGIKGFQYSINAAIGASYNFNRHIAVYLEPGVSYYFAQKSQPASYRTEYPTSFSLKLGLRFGL